MRSELSILNAKVYVKSSVVPFAIVSTFGLLVLRAVLNDDLFGLVPWLLAATVLCALLVFGVLTTKAPDSPAKPWLVLSAFITLNSIVFRSEWLRTATRWQLQSQELKPIVLGSTAPRGEGLQHVQWELSGFAGIANNVSYVVYDPQDHLASYTGTARSIKAPGLPCAVWRLQRLERDWYAADFYTDTDWTSC